MAEQHATFNALNQTTTPIALNGNFSVSIDADPQWEGVIILEKLFADRTEYMQVRNGVFFRSATEVGHEPASTVQYRLRVFKYTKGSAYVRLEDGN